MTRAIAFMSVYSRWMRHDSRVDDIDQVYRRCRSKKRFASRSKAHKWVRHSYRPISGIKMIAYSCPYCEQWHLTGRIAL